MRVIKSKRVISRKINKLIHRYGYLQCFSFLFGYTAEYGFANALFKHKSLGASVKFAINYIHQKCNENKFYALYWTVKINNLLKAI